MMRPMASTRIKLLKMITNFRIGGTERQVINLALGMDSSRIDLHLASMSRSGELLREVERLEVPQPEFRIASLYDPRTGGQVVRLAQYIRQNLIQIVHSYGFYPNVFAVLAARLSGTAFAVASIRDTGDILPPLHRRAQRMVCRLAHCVVVNADAVRDSLVAQGYDPSNIVVIRNGIAMERFDQSSSSGMLRKDLGVPADSRLVVVSSRLNKMKGIGYFLDAAAVLAPRFPDVHFLIVGDGADRLDLERHARSVGLEKRVLFTGFRVDVPELLREATVSVLPSLSEGLSNSLLESMACSVPVVAASVGGNPEVIEHGVTGLLVPPRDSAALAAATARFLENRDLASQFGQAGRRRVTEFFSVERSVSETEQLYHRLLAANGHV